MAAPEMTSSRTSSAAAEGASALQALAAELAQMARAALSESELLAAVVQRLVAASSAVGGVVWLVVSRSGTEVSLKLAAGVDEAAGAGEPGSILRQQMINAVTETILSAQPLVLMPQRQGNAAAAPDVLINTGAHPVVCVPLRSGDDALGALQFWFQAGAEAQKLAELAVALTALATDLGPRLRSRHVRDLGVEAVRQQRLVQFNADLVGVLNPAECATLASAHARELLGINRVTLLERRGDRWLLLGISGQDSVERKSTLASRMTRLVAALASEQAQVIVRPLANEQSSRNDPAVGDYFEHSQMHAAAVLPLRSRPGEWIGAMLCESVEAEVFGPPGAVGETRTPLLTLALWLADAAGKALGGALAHHSIPLGPALASLGRWGSAAGRTKRRRSLVWTSIVMAGLAVGSLWPVTMKIEAGCSILPRQRAFVTTESPGRVEEVLVREGDSVKKGDAIARLDTTRLQTELEAVMQTRRRMEAEAERQRGQGKEALARIASLDAQTAAEQEKHVRREIEFARMLAPIDGVVLTKEIHLRTGMFLQAGEAIAELATTDAWDLRLEVDEGDISLVEAALDKQRALTVRYLLYTQSERPLEAELKSKQEISPALQPGKTGGMFIITLPSVPIPGDMQPIIRPGLTGRAKIDLERRPAGAVLLRKFVRWLRMRWWL